MTFNFSRVVKYPECLITVEYTAIEAFDVFE